MYFLRATRPSTISAICGCISGSPPGIDTIGAPHSSTARKHSSGERLCLSTCAGYWILPQPARAKGQIAAEERLQHQHQRIALAAFDLLLQDVRGDRPHLRNRNTHAVEPRLAFSRQLLAISY